MKSNKTRCGEWNESMENRITNLQMTSSTRYSEAWLADWLSDWDLRTWRENINDISILMMTGKMLNAKVEGFYIYNFK